MTSHDKVGPIGRLCSQFSLFISSSVFFVFLSLKTLGAVLVVPSNGPFIGGNIVVVTNATPAIGNGLDIEWVSVGGVHASTIYGQGTNWVRFLCPPATSPGTYHIRIQSTSKGLSGFNNSYVYNRQGTIGEGDDRFNWEAVAPLPAARIEMGAGVLNGSLFVVGGLSGTTPRTNMYRFDGRNWSEVAGLPSARYQHASATLGSSLYVMGGYDNETKKNVYRFDGSNWTEVAALPAVRSQLASAVAGGSLYAIGGYSGSAISSNVYRYNGTSWSSAASLPQARINLAAATLNGSVYAIGGYLTPSSGVGTRANVYRFDGSTWTEVSPLPGPRYALAAASLDGAIFAVGGHCCGDVPNAMTNVYRYDGTNWTEIPGLPAGRMMLVADTLNNHLYAIGGYSGGSQRNNVYRYPRVVGSEPGVSPLRGSCAGGYEVTIRGDSLGNGSDITNVILCGVKADIVSQNVTQVLVLAAGNVPGIGDVQVASTSHGLTVRTNGFTYGNDYKITALSGLNGTISPSGTVDVFSGSSTSFIVRADRYYWVESLVTNGVTNSTAAFTRTYTCLWNTVTADGTVSVIFAEALAPFGTPEWWLAQHDWTNDYVAAETNDTDHDFSPAWQEWIAGTSPTNYLDYFCIEQMTTEIIPDKAVLIWQSVSNRMYSVYYNTNLLSLWPTTTVYQIQGDGTQKFYTNSEFGMPQVFRIGVDLSP